MRFSPVSTQILFSAYRSPAEKNSRLPGKNDVVTISEEGKRRQAQDAANRSSIIGSLDDFMDGAGKDGVITLDEIQTFGEGNLEKAEEILAETLEQLGLSYDSSLSVRTDEQGEVRVTSDLSAQDNDRLASALNEHPDFQQALTKAGSSQALMDAAKKHMEFSRAYAQDPGAAVARYGIGLSSSGEVVLEYALGQASLVSRMG